MRDTFSGFGLRVDHMVRANAREDLAVRLADRLRPDLRNLEVDQVGSDEHARLDGRADGDDGDGEVLRAYLAQRVDAARIRLHGVRDTL